jgi:hypothetical protein
MKKMFCLQDGVVISVVTLLLKTNHLNVNAQIATTRLKFAWLIQKKPIGGAADATT